MTINPDNSQTTGTRLLVCGGRDYADRLKVYSHLAKVHADRRIACIINGAASGADRLSTEWARSVGVPVLEFPADWSLGRKAGPIRNRIMLSEGKPDEVVAFPGGRGTADMVNAARVSGVPVWEYPHV